MDPQRKNKKRKSNNTHRKMQAEEENFYDEEYGLLKKIGRYKTNK